MSKRNAFDALDPEILDRVVSRRDAFRKAGNVAGAMALASMPVAFAVMAKDAFAQGMPADVTGVLNFALTLEYLEDEFYRTGLETSGLIAAENLPVFQQIRKGWITNAEVDVPALAAVYAGEDNRTQAGVDISGLGTAAAVSEAFDEPLTQDEVLAIAGRFPIA